jgi:hypothetical protein
MPHATVLLSLTLFGSLLLEHLSTDLPSAIYIMAQPGILSWATSIRAAMVNDPCRQSLEDQIQMHGFLFLDDYLDNIFAQARQE